MYSMFLGAGFSKWAVNLPLMKELFDFKIHIFNHTDEKRIEVVKMIKDHWAKDQMLLFCVYEPSSAGLVCY
jgi:hypothetical protein